MFKNVASQKISVYAYDSTTGAPKTGDSGNISVYVSKDYGSVTQLGDTSATEMDSTNAKGWYLFDLTQAETNADACLFTGKSSTSNIYIVGQLIYTNPANFTTTSIDSNGRVDVIKIAGTTQTARDIGASVLLSSGTGTGQLSITSGIAKVDVDTIKTNPVVNAGTITFPTTATLASTTNITAGTIATVTNLTNAPTAGDLTATMKTSVTTAATAATPTAAAVTGNVGGNVTGSVGSVVGAVGSVTGLTASNLDTTVSSRLATAGYTAPDNTSITAIKTKTDSLTFTVANKVDSNIKSVNNVTVTGDGSVGTPWGP